MTEPRCVHCLKPIEPDDDCYTSIGRAHLTCENAYDRLVDVRGTHVRRLHQIRDYAALQYLIGFHPQVADRLNADAHIMRMRLLGQV